MKKIKVVACVIVTIILGAIASVGSAEPTQFTNQWGQTKSELVISPVTGALTRGWEQNNGDYHRIILAIGVQEKIHSLSFDAQVVAVDEVVTVLDALEFNVSGLPQFVVNVWSNLAYIGFDGDSGVIPGSFGTNIFTLRSEDGDLHIDTGRIKAIEPTVEDFDPFNAQDFGFGFLESTREEYIPAYDQHFIICEWAYPFDINTGFEGQITSGPTLLQPGLWIATYRQDLNLCLECRSCPYDHIDHYYLKFELGQADQTTTLSATLYRFGRPWVLSTQTLTVGFLEEDEYGSIRFVGDQRNGIDQLGIHYVASSDFINRLNDEKDLLLDDDGDGFVELPIYIVASSHSGDDQEFSGGIRISNMDVVTTSGPEQLLALTAGETSGKILRYDGKAGAFIDEFIFLDSCRPVDMVYGPDGKLYVARIMPSLFGYPWDRVAVKRFDGRTGEFMEFDDEHADFIYYSSQMNEDIKGLAFGPDGNLYISNGFYSGNVFRYDGQTGNFIDKFVPSDNNELDHIGDLVFGTDGNLYVISNNAILRFKGPLKDNPGDSMGEFVSAGSGGLSAPTGFVFGPEGNLYVSENASGRILSFKGPFKDNPGEFMGEFVPAGSGGLSHPADLTFASDGNLYVSSHGTNHVLRYDGQTGTFLGAFAFIRSPGALLFSSVPEPAPTLGDFNGDGSVDRDDVTFILACIRLGSCDLSFDLNGDGKVNIADARKLVVLFTNL